MGAAQIRCSYGLSCLGDDGFTHAALSVGYVVAVLTGAGTAMAQLGGAQVLTVQLDTSNCDYGVRLSPAG